MASMAESLDMPQVNPWMQDSTPAPSQDDIGKAILGFHAAVNSGQMSPEEGLSRLKKFGAVHSSTKVEDLLPHMANTANTERAPAYDKRGDTRQAQGDTARSNITNPAGAPANTPTMNSVGRRPAQEGPENYGGGPETDYNDTGTGIPGGSSGWAFLGGQPSTVRMNEASDTSNRSDTNKHTITSQILDPQQEKLALQMAMGYEPQQALDMFGKPQVDMYGRPVYDTEKSKINPMHPYQQQQRALQGMENLVKMQHEIGAGAPLSQGVNLAPLAALADAWNAERGVHTNLGAGYTPPETPEASLQRLMGQQGTLAKERMDLLKSLPQNLRAIKPSTTLADTLAQAMENKTASSEKDVLNKGGQIQMTQDERSYRQLVHDVKNNPEVRKNVAGITAIKSGLNMLNSPNLNPQLFHEAQINLRAGMQAASGSKTIGDERMSTYMNNIGVDMDTVKQILSMNPQMMDRHAPAVEHFRKVAEEVIPKLENLRQQHIEALGEGYASMLARRPDHREDLDRLMKAELKIGGGMVTPAPKAKPSPGKPKAGTTTEVQAAAGPKAIMKQNPDGTWSRNQ
jgi:hypothetical protein